MSENQIFLKKIKEKAHNYDKYSGCSQSVLLSLQEAFNIGCKESFMAATVLSGGIARRGETCGALLGVLMALGLVSGREDIKNTERFREAMVPANEICDSFKETLKKEFRFKGNLESTLCREIQEKIYGRSFNMNDKTEYQAFLDAGGHGDNGCPKVCGVAALVGARKIHEIRAQTKK